MKIKNLAPALSAALMLISTSAFAQMAATASTDLNIRSGPGPQYPVVGLIKGEAETMVNGCLDQSKWCAVSYEGTDGWAYSEYLMGDVAGEMASVVEKREDMGVPVATYDGSADGTMLGGTGGAIAGALIAGPIGAVVGGVIGATAGGTADELDQQVQTYVVENPGDPVFLDGEVVLGAGIPQEVELREIPDVAEYRYLNVNGQLVLVKPEDRTIAYIVR